MNGRGIAVAGLAKRHWATAPRYPGGHPEDSLAQSDVSGEARGIRRRAGWPAAPGSSAPPRRPVRHAGGLLARRRPTHQHPAQADAEHLHPRGRLPAPATITDARQVGRQQTQHDRASDPAAESGLTRRQIPRLGLVMVPEFEGKPSPVAQARDGRSHTDMKTPVWDGIWDAPGACLRPPAEPRQNRRNSTGSSFSTARWHDPLQDVLGLQAAAN